MNPAAAWDWSKFKGSDICLKLVRRDMEILARVVELLAEWGPLHAVVQAGGNLGIFAKYLASCFDAVYTFEPSPELFPMLCANAPEQNIVRFQAALGCTRDYVSTLRARRYRHHMPAHEGVTHVTGEGIIPTMQIDDLHLPYCDLIYLDIEGYELKALRGAQRTILTKRPAVVTEINDCIELSGDSAPALKAFMHSMGYRLAFVQHADHVFMPTERFT